MAVETKLGLVVGLAFIICFGVILTHRGRADRISTDVALELLSRQHRNDRQQAAPEDSRKIQPVSHKKRPIAPPSGKVRRGTIPPPTTMPKITTIEKATGHTPKISRSPVAEVSDEPDDGDIAGELKPTWEDLFVDEQQTPPQSQQARVPPRP